MHKDVASSISSSKHLQTVIANGHVSHAVGNPSLQMSTQLDEMGIFNVEVRSIV